MLAPERVDVWAGGWTLGGFDSGTGGAPLDDPRSWILLVTWDSGYNPTFRDEVDWADSSSPFFLADRVSRPAGQQGGMIG
jgi:hypothetical protein